MSSPHCEGSSGSGLVTPARVSEGDVGCGAASAGQVAEQRTFDQQQRPPVADTISAGGGGVAGQLALPEQVLVQSVVHLPPDAPAG